MPEEKAKSIIESNHDEYDALKPDWDAFRLADLGGTAYAKAALRPHKREKAVDFEARKLDVGADDFCSKIIDTRNSFLFHEAPTIKAPKGVLDLVETVDAKSNSLNVFMQRASRVAAVYGTALIVIDQPEPMGEMRTHADVVEQGMRPYMLTLAPTEMPNWGENPDGTLSWALLRQPGNSTTLDPVSLTETSTEEAAFILWTPEAWYRLDKDGHTISTGENTIGVVPIVPIRYREIEGRFHGQSLLNSPESLNRELINFNSSIGTIAANQAFSQLVTEGPLMSEKRTVDAKGKSVLKEVDSGIFTTLAYSKGTTPPQYISPDASQMRVLMERANEVIEKILEKAELTRGAAREGGGQQASGISKAFDFLPTNKSLINQAHLIADAFERALELFGKWLGVKAGNDEYSIEFPKDFGVQTSGDLLDEYHKLNSLMQPPPPDLNARLLKAYAMVRFPEDTPEERDKLANAIDSQTLPGGDYNAEPPPAKPIEEEPDEVEDEVA